MGVVVGKIEAIASTGGGIAVLRDLSLILSMDGCSPGAGSSPPLPHGPLSTETQILEAGIWREYVLGSGRSRVGGDAEKKAGVMVLNTDVSLYHLGQAFE